MARLDIPLTKYFSPCFQFDRFRAMREHYGDEAVLTTDRFQREREAWIAAAFLMGYSELTEQFWWLTICPGIGPEIIAIMPRKGPQGWVAERMNLAIFAYARHAPVAGVAAAIERKLRNEAYPADSRLICYVSHRAGEAFDTGAVAAQLRGRALPVAEVWLIGSVESDQSDDYMVSRLHPAPREQRLSYGQYCAETPQLTILDVGQGSSEEVRHGFMEIELPLSSVAAPGTKQEGSMANNNNITNVPQPARSILRNYPDSEAVASLHAGCLAAVASGDDGAIQEAQQHIETLLAGKNQIFERRNRPERVRYEPEHNCVVVRRGARPSTLSISPHSTRIVGPGGADAWVRMKDSA